MQTTRSNTQPDRKWKHQPWDCNSAQPFHCSFPLPGPIVGTVPDPNHFVPDQIGLSSDEYWGVGISTTGIPHYYSFSTRSSHAQLPENTTPSQICLLASPLDGWHDCTQLRHQNHNNRRLVPLIAEGEKKARYALERHSLTVYPIEQTCLGFLIDIDGVLLRGKSLIPGSKEALQVLFERDIPFVLFSNGTSTFEPNKIQVLNELLRSDYPEKILEERLVLASTPLAAKFEDHSPKGVLVITSQPQGEEQRKEFCRIYNLKNVLFLNELANSTQPQVIDYIVIHSEPSNWERAIQLVCDVVASNGKNEIPERIPFGADWQQQVHIYACNPDISYVSEHPIPRFTSGSFIHCIATLFQTLFGHPLAIDFLGKPYPPIYALGLQKLHHQSKSRHLRSIFGVGDNIYSDITGANQANLCSVLVRTGVFKASFPEIPPHLISNNFADALDFIQQFY